MRDLDMRQNEAGDNTKQKDAAQNTRPKNILESFEYIVELAENSNLDKEFFEKASTHIKYAARKLRLAPMQVVLLSMFIDRSEDLRIKISEIARYAGSVNHNLALSNNIQTANHIKQCAFSRSRSA